jgi:hypothetical protein
LSYYWLCLGESKVIEKDMKSFFQYDDGQKMIPVVGSIYLGEKEVMIRTIAKVNFDFAKKMVDVYWGESLKYRREVVVELGKQMAERDAEGRCRIPGGDDDREMYENKAPLSEMDKMKLTDLYNKHYETFSDVAMNDLDGMTPMNAAKSVNMRSRLIEFMKWHINHVGFVNKKQELSIDISWLLEELGLHELL